MGDRKAGAEDFHADRDQVASIEGAVPKGDTVEILAPELGVSGGLPLEQRPSLLKAVEGVESGAYAGIIVAYLSRLGRNVAEQLRTFDRVHEAGGRIIVAQEGFDARTRGGRLQRNILAAIHEDEREQHVERFDNLRRWSTEAGIWKMRQTPTGYDRDPETRKLVPNERAADVHAAFLARATGTPLVHLADRLRMTPSGARNLLRNRAYLGEIHQGPYVNTSAHPPIVTVEEFEAAQVDSARPRRSSDWDGPALLAGIARCQSCGHVLARGRTKSVVYGCAVRHSGGRCPRPAAITMRILDDHVLQIVGELFSVMSVSVAASAADGKAARERLATAERELAAFIEAVSAADVGAKAFAAGARQRRAAVEDARTDLRRHIALQPVLPELTTGVGGWGDLDVHGRNQLLRALLEVVIVRPAGGRGARSPVGERVRVVRAGVGFPVPKKHGIDPLGIFELDFPDLDDERVLRVLGGE